MNGVVFIFVVNGVIQVFDELEEAMNKFKANIPATGNAKLVQAIKRNGGTEWITTVLSSITNGEID